MLPVGLSLTGYAIQRVQSALLPWWITKQKVLENTTFVRNAPVKECILDPYLYEIDGKMVLLTSAMVPVMSDGKFYGTCWN